MTSAQGMIRSLTAAFAAASLLGCGRSEQQSAPDRGQALIQPADFEQTDPATTDSGLAAPESKEIAVGMTMASAAEIAAEYDLVPTTMAFDGEHVACSLPDGRSVVVFGEDTVEEITLIPDATLPKSKRTYEDVESVQL